MADRAHRRVVAARAEEDDIDGDSGLDDVYEDRLLGPGNDVVRAHMGLVLEETAVSRAVETDYESWGTADLAGSLGREALA